MRGDSYQLQGQGGGVVIEDGEQASGKFRSILVIREGEIIIESANIVNSSGVLGLLSLGVLASGKVVNGLFNTVEVVGASSKAICYYE